MMKSQADGAPGAQVSRFIASRLHAIRHVKCGLPSWVSVAVNRHPPSIDIGLAVARLNRAPNALRKLAGKT
jgi:hypothetical protein